MKYLYVVLISLFIYSPLVSQIAFTNLGVSVGLGQGGFVNPDINDGTNGSSFSNSSWTPPTTGLIVVYATAKQVTGGPTFPTASGNSLTWVQIQTVDCTSTHGLTLFGADATGSTTGATTFDFSGNEQQHLTASFFQVTGVDLSGGVAAAFVQTPTNEVTGTSISVTLAAAGAADNRPISGVLHDDDEVSEERTNWTEVDDMHDNSRVRGLITQSRADAFETTASASWVTSAGNVCIIAAELKASVAGPSGQVIMIITN